MNRTEDGHLEPGVDLGLVERNPAEPPPGAFAFVAFALVVDIEHLGSYLEPDKHIGEVAGKHRVLRLGLELRMP